MRDERAFLSDMAFAARRAVRFLGGRGFEAFLADEMAQEAIIRQLAVIGEAAKKISPQTRRALPGLPFDEMAKMRDVLVHVYWGIKLDIVFATARDDLEPLIRAVEANLTPPETPGGVTE